MAIATAVDDIEFAELRGHLDVSDSVLSKHLAALATAGYVRLRKGVRSGRRTTWIAATGAGRKAFRGHVQALRELIGSVGTAVDEERIGNP